MMKAPMNLTAVDPAEEAARLFTDLLQAAESKNPLYYHLNLQHMWGMMSRLAEREAASSMDFTTEINRITQALLLDRLGRGERVPPHEVLFVFQLNMESKQFYGTVRNFANIVREERVAAEPWRTNEMRGGGLQTSKIIDHVVTEIRQAGCAELAAEFADAHGREARTIRNATAHGNVRMPDHDTGGEWIFGEYEGKPPHVWIKTTRMTPAEFRNVCSQFFGFRFGFFRAMQRAIAQAKTETRSFQAANQMKRDEQLACQLENGDLCVKYRGTPLW